MATTSSLADPPPTVETRNGSSRSRRQADTLVGFRTTQPGAFPERGNLEEDRAMAMELVTGQEVWVAFAAAASSGIGGPPVANVHRAVVIDGENRVLKRDNGYVGICQTWSVEQCFPTEAAAWPCPWASAAGAGTRRAHRPAAGSRTNHDGRARHSHQA